jgi:hypothetical protein
MFELVFNTVIDVGIVTRAVRFESETLTSIDVYAAIP